MVLFGDGSLIFILHWNIHSVKGREPERIVGGHIEPLARWQVISKEFQYLKDKR